MNRTLKPSQAAALREDYEAATEALTHPDMSPYIQDKLALRKQAKQLKDTLDMQAPHPYESAQEKDTAAKRERELRESFLEGIPSRQEMAKNRDGSVYKHMKWEKANKPKIMEWREIVKRLEPDSDDPDLTSYEKYRPDRPFVYDPNAQIPGIHMMSEQAKQNWPDEMAEPKAKTAVSHLNKKK
jgi:hypothetical protein